MCGRTLARSGGCGLFKAFDRSNVRSPPTGLTDYDRPKYFCRPIICVPLQTRHLPPVQCGSYQQCSAVKRGMFSCPSPSCRHFGSRLQTSEQKIRFYLYGENGGVQAHDAFRLNTPHPSPLPDLLNSNPAHNLYLNYFTSPILALFFTPPLLPYPYHSNDRPTPPPSPLGQGTRHGGGPGRPAAASRRPSRRACGPPSSPTRPDSWRSGGPLPPNPEKIRARDSELHDADGCLI